MIDTSERLKRCSTCENFKPVSEFHRNRKAPDGLSYKCKSCRRDYYENGERARRLKDPDRGLRAWLRHGYGISLELYKSMETSQNGLCAICGMADEVRSRLSVDHCHETGRIRGLLCQRCNTSIGGFRDNPDILRSAISYLNQGGTK